MKYVLLLGGFEQGSAAMRVTRADILSAAGRMVACIHRLHFKLELLHSDQIRIVLKAKIDGASHY